MSVNRLPRNYARQPLNETLLEIERALANEVRREFVHAERTQQNEMRAHARRILATLSARLSRLPGLVIVHYGVLGRTRRTGGPRKRR